MSAATQGKTACSLLQTLCPAAPLLQGQEELAACVAAAVVPLMANATELLAP